MDMPPPPVLPKRSPKGMFSSFYMLVHGRSVYVPHGAVVRNHGSPPLKALRDRIPHPRDVIVLAARDTEGDTQYGWFVRYETEANRLIRMPYTTVEALWAYVHKIPELQECSLNTNYVDAYFSSDTLDFETIAIMRFDQLKKTLTAHSSKKRQRDTDNQSVPASPSRVAVLGQCTICLEEDVDLHVPTCCGTGGATCADCHAKMRNLCPVCERAKVNANYQCQACNSVVRLKDYGHPCATCSACVLCDGCYADYGECANCDPVRGA